MNLKERPCEKDPVNGMRQSNGAMIAKIAFGALFLLSGLTTVWASDETGAMLMSILLGLALIAWGLVPRLKAKKKLAEAAAQAEAARQAEQQRLLNEPKLCPACGATTKGKCCEYCGTFLN